MKNGKNPTLKQKKFIRSHKLRCENWLVSKDTSEKMVLINRKTGKPRELKKEK